MAELISEGPFVTDGEEQAAILLKQLPDPWLVIANKTLVTSPTTSYEVDFIVVGDRTIFVLDEKSWGGEITGSSSLWVAPWGEAIRSPLDKATDVARKLASRLKGAVPELQSESARFCYGAVLLSLSETPPRIDDPRAANFIYLRSSVLERMVKVDGELGSPLVGQHREAIKRALTSLENRLSVPKQVGAYTIVESLGERPGCRIFRADLAGVERQIMIYDLGRDPTQTEELKAFYLQEFRALSQLSAQGIAPRTYEPLLWSDNFLILPTEYVRSPSLRTFGMPETVEGFVNELLIARSAFEKLAMLHRAGIVHRALSPDAVHLTRGETEPQVIFSNFYAARLGGESIAVRLDELRLNDPYAAPDLRAGYGNASPATDVYSLALVFLERFARQGVSELTAGGEQVSIPLLRSEWPALPPAQVQAVGTFLQSALQRQRDAQSLAEGFGGLAALLRADVLDDQGRQLDGRYRVVRRLGQGMNARTFLVDDIYFNGRFVVKQYLQPTRDLDQAAAEFWAMRDITCPNLARVYDVYPPDKEVHVKMEYIPGQTLAEMAGSFPWAVEQWWEFAQGMLNALEALETHELLHRDIKPANIVLREDNGAPVLIDFGFAVRLGLEIEWAGAPRYVPPEALAEASPPASTDRYALAMVLVEVLTGMRPPQRAGEPLAAAQGDIGDERSRRLYHELLRCLDANPQRRPKSVQEMRSLLQNALSGEESLPGRREINEWVDQVRSLYRNSDSGNANNRGLDSDFVRQTYVPTALDERLLPRLLAERPLAVFLSGNPGDGKTAFLGIVKDALLQQGAATVRGNPSGWELRLGDYVVRSCYDASEAFETQSADEQLTGWLAGLEGTREPAFAGTVLVAINDGRLVDFFERNRERFDWLAEQVDAALQIDGGANARVWVVDMKRRAFVQANGGGPSLLRRLLDKLVDPGKWEVCQSCIARAACPLLANATALQQPAPAARLEELFLLTHLRRQRHITMRDLRSALAYLLTANTNCEEVHRTREGEGPPVPLVDRRYWHAVFTAAGQGDDLLDDLALLDPAQTAQPAFDRLLHAHRSPGDAPARAQLFTDGTDLPREHYDSDGKWMDAVKHRIFFEGRATKGSWEAGGHHLNLLPYRYAYEFIALITRQMPASKALAALAAGILRSDRVYGHMQRDTLAVVAAASDEQHLVVLKEFPLPEFTLRVDHPENPWELEAVAETLVLEHTSGAPRLEIGIDLFELLRRLTNGERADAPEFVPLLEDLAPFKSALLLRQSTDLVLVENLRRYHRVTQRSGMIVRLEATEGGQR